MKALETLHQLPAMQEIIAVGGEVFLVGGVVRDHYMMRESKDIDIIVRLIALDDLTDLLQKYGKVELVGQSFGVLKFIPHGWVGEPLDVALPRTEKKESAGYQGFVVTSDPNLPIELDLHRRDFSINAIAVAFDGTVIDPFNGIDSIENEVIEAVSPEAFSEDPLRMLRAVQFAARFGFTIESNTVNMIKAHARDIAEISAERVLIELDKIQSKGNITTGIELLNSTGLSKHIFGCSLLPATFHTLTSATRPEFYATLLHQFANPGSQFTNLLKGDTDTAKMVDALLRLHRTITPDSNDTQKRLAVVSTIATAGDGLLDLASVQLLLGEHVVGQFAAGMPKRVTELALNGNDLMTLGLTGKTIGDTMKLLLSKVLYLELVNEKESLLSFVIGTVLDTANQSIR